MNENKLQNAIAALKSLESYGYKEQIVNVGDVKIILAPLTADETIEVFESSGKYEDPDASIQKLKVETVARSVINVNDVVFDPKTLLDQKLQIVASFGDELVDYLFDQYCILDKIVKDAVDKRFVKESKIEQTTNKG
jgi:hypothetical protein